jgi:hypothetical protein
MLAEVVLPFQVGVPFHSDATASFSIAEKCDVFPSNNVESIKVVV